LSGVTDALGRTAKYEYDGQDRTASHNLANQLLAATGKQDSMKYMLILFAIGLLVSSILSCLIYKMVDKSSTIKIKYYFTSILIGLVSIFLFTTRYFFTKDSKVLCAVAVFISFMIMYSIVLFLFQKSFRNYLLNNVVISFLSAFISSALITSFPMLVFVPPICSFAWPDTTVYSPSYTEADFQKIKTGMTMNEVEEILGAPIRKVGANEDAEKWMYSKSKYDSHYYWRSVCFKNRKVLKKEAYFYVD
jgi:YD repeat-containing protein